VFHFPEGPASPIPAPDVRFVQATAACRQVRTLTAEIHVSGMAGRNKVRGRVLAGFERPDRVRLEAVAPFGAPVFILAAGPAHAVLWLPRDRHVARTDDVAPLVDALIGLPWQAADLLALASGCVVAEPDMLEGHQFRDGSVLVTLRGDVEAIVRAIDGAPRLLAARPLSRESHEAAWTRHYAAFAGSFPATVHLGRQDGSSPAVVLTLQLSQIETNVTIDPAAFDVNVPPDAVPLSLDELRRMRPIGGTPSRSQ
jgi:hypothetical protein